MKKVLASFILSTGLLSIPYTVHDMEVNTISYPTSPRTEKVVKKIRDDVLFTIDDGPSVYMMEIAKTLDSLQYQWIFYVVTRGIKESTRKDLVEVIKMWHHIGNHSFSHPNFQTLTIDQAKEQILKGDSLITSVYQEAGIPREKKYIRFPYGNQPPQHYRQEFNEFLDSLWYEKPMYWRMDVLLNECAQTPTDDRIVRMKEGDTILLHERSWTPETIEKIVQNLDLKKEI